MKNAILFFLLASVFQITFSQSGWQRMTFTYSTDIADIQFIDQYTGYFAAGRNYAPGSVHKSTDGGVSWFLVFQTSKPMRALYFSGANTGTVVGQRTNLRRTYTGGNTWYWFAPLIGYNSINAVHFVGDKTGWVAGDSSYIFRTNDYSATWINVSPAINNITWNDIYFFDYKTGFVIGESSSSSPIFKTTNEGVSWTEITGHPGSWKRISFCNSQTGFIAGTGSSSGLLKTTDGGLTWDVNGSSNEYNDVFCVNPSVVYAIGPNGLIHKTTDGGNMWLDLTSGTNEALYGIHFLNSETGWVCGDHGVILKTTTGGIIPIGIKQTGSEIPDKFSLGQNYPNPFNPLTIIKFAIPLLRGGDAEGGRGVFVRIAIYDILGNEITVLVNEQLKAGTYEVTWDASDYPSGAYFYSLQSGEYTASKKMALVK